MDCISPPELTEAQLLAHLDRQADSHVKEHLERCSHCRQRAEYLTRFQDHMIARLYRFTCPSPSGLGEYYLGMLPDAPSEAVRLHLAECPHCIQELAQLKNYISELAPDIEFSPLERVRVVIAQLVEGGRSEIYPRSSPLALAGVGLRGEQEGPLLYQAEGIQIALETQENPQAPGSQSLLGLVTGTDLGDWEAHLWQGDQLVTTTPVDDLGNFFISLLASGQYELILTGPELEIHVQALPV